MRLGVSLLGSRNSTEANELSAERTKMRALEDVVREGAGREHINACRQL